MTKFKLYTEEELRSIGYIKRDLERFHFSKYPAYLSMLTYSTTFVFKDLKRKKDIFKKMNLLAQMSEKISDTITKIKNELLKEIEQIEGDNL